MGQKTVLIVDDSRAAGDLIEMNLSDTYRILRAYDGEEGLRKIEEYQPDLVLLDMLMPKISGIDVIIRLGPTYTNPIIVVTANRMKLSDFEGYECVKAVSDKRPQDMQRLKEKIDELIGDAEPLGEM